MNKLIKTCLCFAMLTYCTKSTAQVDTSTTQKLLQYIFQPIDKNQIPTGFLEEYGCPMLPAATFNGTLTDSNRIDMNLWRTLYLQLQTGWTRVTANPLPTITSVNTTIKQNVSNALPIPIPLLIASYNTVKSNAFTSNLLSYSSTTKKVSDVAGRSQSPYDLKTLFAACPNKKITTTGSESFIIQSNMIWNNTGKTISQIQIDFANGQGFQTVTIGSAVSITYTDTGFKKWTIKVTLNDNSILQCYNEYNVLRTANVSSRFQNFQTTLPAWGIIDAVNGTRTAATVTVNFSRNNFTGTLRKPLIVVEGYDVCFIAPSLQPFNYSSRDFIDAITFEPGNTFDFNNQLDSIAGYDLVFINFADGSADIVLNAGAVQEVIRQVNLNKVNDNRFGNIRQQNVVMGLSMGGLCARYALANMTKNISPASTETRLLITHDSPHKGANVPLGLQYMIRMLGGVQLFGYNVYDIYPDYNDAIGLLGAAATQQMLLYRAITTNTFANNTFLDATYRPMITFAAPGSGPQPTYRFVATANGNECANPLFSPGKTFINLGAGVSAGIFARFLFFKVPIVSYKLAAQVEAYALPAAGSTNKIAKVYSVNNLKLFGFINIFKQLYDNTAYAPGTHLAVDGVPGSNYPLLDVDALSQLTNLPIFKVNLYVAFPLGPFLGGYFGIYAYNAGVSYNFTFVSTASALDAGPYNTPIFSQKYVNGTNQNYPSTSETFIAQETVPGNAALTNNVHIRFTARNSRWLFNEMENLPNLENCSAECSNPFYITGINPLCGSSAVYTVPGMQRGANIVWSATPTGIVTIAQSINIATLTKIGNGDITLTATITNSCIGTPPAITKVITVGTPNTTCQELGNGICNKVNFLCPSQMNNWQYVNFTGSSNASVTGYHIEVNGGGYFNNGLSSQEITSPYFSVYVPSGGNNVTVWAKNACGTSQNVPYVVAHAPKYYGCSGGYSVTPNPASTTITVAPASPEENSSALKATSVNSFTEIQIVDKLGNLKKKMKFAEGTSTTKIDISSLPTDTYILRINSGGNWEEYKIVVTK